MWIPSQFCWWALQRRYYYNAEKWLIRLCLLCNQLHIRLQPLMVLVHCTVLLTSYMYCTANALTPGFDKHPFIILCVFKVQPEVCPCINSTLLTHMCILACTIITQSNMQIYSADFKVIRLWGYINILLCWIETVNELHDNSIMLMWVYHCSGIHTM